MLEEAGIRFLLLKNSINAGISVFEKDLSWVKLPQFVASGTTMMRVLTNEVGTFARFKVMV